MGESQLCILGDLEDDRFAEKRLRDDWLSILSSILRERITGYLTRALFKRNRYHFSLKPSEMVLLDNELYISLN